MPRVVFLPSFPFGLTSAVSAQFQCDGCTAAGVAAAAGFAEICLQFTEADTVNQSGGRCQQSLTATLLPLSPGSLRASIACVALHLRKSSYIISSRGSDSLESKLLCTRSVVLQVTEVAYTELHFSNVGRKSSCSLEKKWLECGMAG